MQERTYHFAWLRRALAAIALVAIAGCSQQPTYRVVNAPVARTGPVESVREEVEQKDPSALGLIAGGLIGDDLGGLVGGGTGRTVATVVGALGGDNGTWGTIPQTASPPFRIGDRFLVTDQGLEYLR